MTSATRPPLDVHVRLAVFRTDGYECQHCGVIGTFLTLQVDHVVPWSWGGTHIFENLQTLCVDCNRRKGARYVG